MTKQKDWHTTYTKQDLFVDLQLLGLKKCESGLYALEQENVTFYVDIANLSISVRETNRKPHGFILIGYKEILHFITDIIKEK